MSASSVGGGMAARMRWLEARTRVLAENVANADTPRFKPRDLTMPGQDRLAPSATQANHLGDGRSAAPSAVNAARFETRPSGNAVNLEDEMLKLSETQLEYQLVAGLYQKSLSRLRTAIGRRG